MKRQAIRRYPAAASTARDTKIYQRLTLWAFFLLGLMLLPMGGDKPLIQRISLRYATPVESYVPHMSELDLANLDTDTISTVSLEDSDIWTRITVKTGDTLSKIFERLGLGASQLDEVLSMGEDTKSLTRLFPGQTLHFLIQGDKLRAIAQPIDPARVLYVVQNDEGFGSVLHEKEVESRIAFGGAKIEDSLLGSGKEAGIDTRVLMQLVDIFGYDIDFAMDIQPNDHFRILYEEQYVDGEKMRTGNVLAAEFVNDGRVYRAIRYEDKDGRINYYTPDGESLRKAFIRTPVNFTHISSHFNLRRKHPILHKIRAHKGVDYAAPIGTPVRAAGNGRVQFVGSKGGYGKTIVVQHGKRYSTLYAHLSRFATKLRNGQNVQQGQVIGYVGMTGLASGPHLHYEFRVDGVHRNPLTVSLPMSESLANKEKMNFKKHAARLLATMDRQQKENERGL